MFSRLRLVVVALTLGISSAVAVASGGTAGAVSQRALSGHQSALSSGLDPGFGSSGVSTLSDSSFADSTANAVATIPNCPSSGTCAWSKIAGDAVSVGQGVTPSGATEYVVEVLNETTGAPASSFNSDGVVTPIPAVSGSEVAAAYAVVVYPACPTAEPACPWASEAGDIVVAGWNGQSIELVWLSPSGATLQTLSVATPSGQPLKTLAATLEVTGQSPSGDVMLAGGDDSGEPLLIAVTPTHTLDTGFGGGTGISDAFIAPSGDTAATETFTGIAADPGGDLVITGNFVSASDGTTSDLVARMDAAGSLDDSFGDGGGSLLAASDAQSGGLALAPTSSGSYDILLVGTAGADSSTQTPEVIALDSSGAALQSFGGGQPVVLSASLKLACSGSSTGVSATGTGIAVQSAGGSLSGIAVTSSQSGELCAAQALVTRLSPSGALVSGFGTDGSLVLPSQLNPSADATAIAPAAGGLDYVAAGVFGSTGTGYATARILGEVLTIHASLGGRPSGWQNADALLLTVTAAESPSNNLGVTCALSAPGGVTFAPLAPATPPTSIESSSTMTIASGKSSASNQVLAMVPDFTGGTTLGVKVTCKSGAAVPVVGAPATFNVSHASPLGAAPAPGYWLVTSGGGLWAFHTPNHGGVTPPPSPVVGVTPTVNGADYWIATQSGRVFGRGVASRGSLPSKPASPVVAIVTDPATNGYWLVERDGVVKNFDAPVFGSPPSPSGAVVGAVAAPDGLGYLLATSTGHVYKFGPGATFHGSVSKPAAPISSIAGDPYTGGYWLLATDGKVYSFDAPWRGADKATPDVSIACDPATTGYFVLSRSGTVTGLGEKSLGSGHASSPFVQVAAR